MSPEIPVEIWEEPYLDIEDPRYPTTRVTGMDNQGCQMVINSANVSYHRQEADQVMADGLPQANPEEVDDPSITIQGLVPNKPFKIRRRDLEKTFANKAQRPKIYETRQVKLITVCDETKEGGTKRFEPYNPNIHPGEDQMNIYAATPSQVEKYLEQKEAFSETAGGPIMPQGRARRARTNKLTAA